MIREEAPGRSPAIRRTPIERVSWARARSTEYCPLAGSRVDRCSMLQTRFVVPTLSALGMAMFLAACSGSSGQITPSAVAPGSQILTHNALMAEQSYRPITLKGYPQLVFRLGYVSNPNGYSRPNADGNCSSPQLSVPNWTSSFKDGSNTYCYQMVGMHPKKTAGSTTLTTQIYAYKLKFSNGDVFDPTAITPSCDSVAPYTRLIDSPLYNAYPDRQRQSQARQDPV